MVQTVKPWLGVDVCLVMGVPAGSGRASSPVLAHTTSAVASPRAVPSKARSPILFASCHSNPTWTQYNLPTERNRRIWQRALEARGGLSAIVTAVSRVAPGMGVGVRTVGGRGLEVSAGQGRARAPVQGRGGDQNHQLVSWVAG